MLFRSNRNVSLQFLASDHPIPDRSPSEMVERMPAKAAQDIVEWYPGIVPLQVFGSIVQHETSIDRIIALAPETPSLQDDRPMNEYFILRELAPSVWRN